MTWQNKTRPKKTAKLPYSYAVSESDPLVLILDLEIIRWVENALDHLDQGHRDLLPAYWEVDNFVKHDTA